MKRECSTMETSRTIFASLLANDKKMKLLNERQKKDIYQEFLKMRKAGYIVHINELSREEQEIINKSPSKYYIAIAPAFKTCSDSTPTRIALDGSFPGCHGKSLNEILPAGKWQAHWVTFAWGTIISFFQADEIRSQLI